MAIAQEDTTTTTGQSTDPSITFDWQPTSGNLLLAVITCGAPGVDTPPAGWTAYPLRFALTNMVGIYYKISAGNENGTSVIWAVNEDTYFGASLFEYSGLTATPADQSGGDEDVATQSLTVTMGSQNATAESLNFEALLIYDDDLSISSHSIGWTQQHLITQENWMNQVVVTKITSFLEIPENVTAIGGGEDKEMQAAMAVFSAVAGQQETTSGTLNVGGGLTASVSAVKPTSASFSGGAGLSATVRTFEGQIARPISTIYEGGWDTGPTASQSLHTYTSDHNDATFIFEGEESLSHPTSGILNAGGGLAPSVIHLEHATTSGVLNGGGGISASVLSSEQTLYIPGYDGNPDVGYLGDIGDLTAYTGPTTLSSGLTTIENKLITDRIDVRNTGSLIIRDCVFDLSNSGSFVFTQWDTGTMPSGYILIEDTTFGTGSNDQGDHFSVETSATSVPGQDSRYDGYGVIVRRTLFQRGRDGMQGGASLYVEQCQTVAADAITTPDYGDGFQSLGALHMKFSYTNFFVEPVPEGYAGLILKTDWGPIDDVIVDNCRIYGGAFNIDLDNDGGQGLVTNIVFTNNIMDGANSGVANNTDGIITWTNNTNEAGTPIPNPAS